MLGRRDPQRSLSDAHAWPHRVPTDSFYARMAAVNNVLFEDDDLAGMYCDNNGRPAQPAAILDEWNSAAAILRRCERRRSSRPPEL